MPRPALAALLVLMTFAAGCTELFGPGAAPGDGVRPEVVREAWFVPDARIVLEHPHRYGNVRTSGPGYAVPFQVGGVEAGAVFFGPLVGWRADLIVDAREQLPEPGDFFVQVPLGRWAELRASQSWVPAEPAQLAAAGYASNLSLFQAASRLFPSNLTPPARDLWAFNGTVAGQMDAQNFTLALTEGPFVFRRNSTEVLIIEPGLIFAWNLGNHTLTVSSEGILSARLLDPSLARFDIVYGRPLQVTLVTPRFRQTDLEVSDDPSRQIFRVVLPQAAEVSVIRPLSKVVEDDRVEVRTANLTFVMRP